MKRTMTRRTFLESGFALSTVGLLAACSGNSGGTNAASSTDAAEQAGSAGAGDAGDASPAALTTVPFSIDYPDSNKSGIYIAMAQGFYAEEGIELEIIQPEDDWGDITIGTGVCPMGIEFQSYMGASFGSDKPLPLTAIAAIAEHSNTGIISLAETGISRPRELEGHTLAMWGVPVELGILGSVVEADGGDFSKVECIPITTDDALLGLQSHMYDAVWSWLSSDIPGAKVRGLELNVFHDTDYVPALDAYQPLIGANAEWLAESDEHAEIARAFLRATKRGYELANTDAELAAESIIAMAPGVDEEVIRAECEEAVGTYFSAGNEWGVIDDAQWTAHFQWMNDLELTDHPFDPTMSYTMEYLEE